MTHQSSSPSSSSSAIVFDGYTVPIQSSKHSRLAGLVDGLKRVQHWFGQGFQQVLAAVAGSSDPIVYQKRDRHGQCYYTIYDPVTQQRTRCMSETDVRAWLEQRYYH